MKALSCLNYVFVGVFMLNAQSLHDENYQALLQIKTPYFNRMIQTYELY